MGTNKCRSESNKSQNNITLINHSENKQRIISVDVLRGLMLVIMTLNHLSGINGIIQRITFQPFGFVAAAEGFIYLSGYVYGLVYSRAFLREGHNYVKTKSFKRAGVIYLYQIIILLLVALPAIINLWDYQELRPFQEQPLKSTLFFLLFLLQPDNMSILPMYVMFILLGPIVIKAFEKGFEKQVFYVSGMLWFASQWKIFQYTNFDLNAYGIDLGYFNILSWQFLFFIGCYLGSLKAKGRLVIPVKKEYIVLATLALIIITVIKHSHSGNIFLSLYYHFADRRTLGIARIISFGIIAYLLYVISIKKQGLLRSKWLALLGRNSLQVFAYSVIMGYYYLPYKTQVRSLSPWLEVSLHLLMAMTLLVPAWIHMKAIKNIPFVKRFGL